MVLSDAVIIDDEMYAPNDESRNGPTSGPENYAYQFEYVRTIGDSLVANMSHLMSDGDGYSLRWRYENITFWVNDNGILSIGWNAHTTTGEIINDDTGSDQL